MGNIKTIAVFCGSSSGGIAYEEAAYNLGKCLSQKGIHLVYGGGNMGLMGCVARGCREAEGVVTGVMPRFLASLKPVQAGEVETELIITENMHERKKKMADLSDAFIALPGGIGTFEEIFEQITWLQLRLHEKPCGFLNVNGFYDKLNEFLRNAVHEGLMKKDLYETLVFEPSAEVLIDKICGMEIKLQPKIR